MSAPAEVTLAVAFRRSPVRMSVFALGPVLLAVAQLLNSVVAGLPIWIAAGFAALMLPYAILYARYHVAQLRLQSLESSAEGRVPRGRSD